MASPTVSSRYWDIYTKHMCLVFLELFNILTYFLFIQLPPFIKIIYSNLNFSSNPSLFSQHFRNEKHGEV